MGGFDRKEGRSLLLLLVFGRFCEFGKVGNLGVKFWGFLMVELDAGKIELADRGVVFGFLGLGLLGLIELFLGFGGMFLALGMLFFCFGVFDCFGGRIALIWSQGIPSKISSEGVTLGSALFCGLFLDFCCILVS